ncbi:MAG: YapH protein [Chitinophagaceae bacterium]|nr:YapH protein [Chitinophagaceae bacterium]
MIAAAGFTAASYAQSTANATATATIVTPIGITKTTDMSFGNIAVGSAGGTVILDTAGARTITGGVTLPATTGTVAAAVFAVTGSGTYTYTITLPTTDVTLTRASGTETMIANTFTSNPSGTGTLVAGAQNVAVGATLTIAGSQVAGVYTSSTFPVTVNYN